MIAATATPTACEARLGRTTEEVDGFPRERPVLCQRTVGIRSYTAADGSVASFCGLPEHEASVRFQHPVAAAMAGYHAGRPDPWADADLGRAIRELARAAREAGYSFPSLMLGLDGWEASAVRVDGRRFRSAQRHVSRNPVTAVETVIRAIESAAS